MREFKYRAWTGKKMFDVDVLAVNPVTWDSSGTGVSLAYQPHIKVMQYTGLKDKNGTEIYEGDIIECLREGNGFVTKRHGAYGIETRFGFYPFIEIHGEFEVIGNIYEHPHLIQRK